LRVTEMNASLGIFHAMLAQLFLLLVTFIALSLTAFWRRLPVQTETDRAHFRFYSVATACLVLGQLALGATMRHQHAGLAIPDFPLAYERLWPDMSAVAVASYNQHRISAVDENFITAFQIELQMIHRLVALAILIVVTVGAWRTLRHFGRRHPLARFTLVWLGLVIVQAFLGAATIWTGKSADIATAHVACGALCLVTGGLTAILSFRLLAAPATQSVATQKNEMTSALASSSISR
jgi:heme a synthase